MAVLAFHILTSIALFPLSLLHLVLSTISYLKPTSNSPYTARPSHPLPISTSHHRLLRDLPLLLAFLLLLLLSFLFLPFLPTPSPLISAQFLPPLFLLSLLAVSHLFLPVSLPTDLTFLLSSLSFALLSSASSHLASSYPQSDLQSRASLISSYISAFSSAASLALAISPRIFLAEVSLAGSVALAGLWSLQSGLFLYADGFIPEGCHLLIGASAPTTRCDLKEVQDRAVALFDLALFLHAALVAVIAVGVYVVVARSAGAGNGRRHNNGGTAYEALPTVTSAGALGDVEHLQMKPISKSAAQE